MILDSFRSLKYCSQLKIYQPIRGALLSFYDKVNTASKTSESGFSYFYEIIKEIFEEFRRDTVRSTYTVLSEPPKKRSMIASDLGR